MSDAGPCPWNVGDKVQRKSDGSYAFPGVVIATGLKLDGKTWHCEVECIIPGVTGCTHVFPAKSMRAMDPIWELFAAWTPGRNITDPDWRISTPIGLEAAITAFKQALPGWWFTVGECQVSADASCGPTPQSPHIKLIAKDGKFDDGFHADLPQPATMADALADVLAQALSAIIAAEAQ